MYTIGVDVGSITTKAALMNNGTIMGTHVIFTGYDTERAAEQAIDELTRTLGIQRGEVAGIWATGYGRKGVQSAEKTVTEIMCHAAGAYFIDPSIGTVIDIGGQDSKVIVLKEEGRVANFVMNDKCAAGTGRFLEVIARALELDLKAFGDLSLRATKVAKISSMCTVFAESEVISLIAAGEARENIIAGIHMSVAGRVTSMVNRLGYKESVMMTGGVAKNAGVVRAMEEAMGTSIAVSIYAQEMGAIGAAFLAARERERH